MNRIYKVIWSKTRNAYVVVSELAKSHGKSKREHGRHANPSTLEKGLVVACLSGGLLLGAPQSVGAVQTVDAGTTTNGDANTLAVGANSTANGKGSLAVGGGSQASGDTAVALAWGSQALSDYSIALGHSAHVGGSYTYVQDGSTSGIRGTAQNAIAIGNTAVANGKDDVVIGTNNTAETPTASYVETNKTGAYAQGGRVIVGHDNSINGRSGNSIAIGSANTINAVHGIALGQNVQAGQKAGATGTKADKTSVTLEYENSMGIGVNAKSLSSNSIALGNGAVAGNERTTDIDTDWNGKGAIAIGETAQATGYYSLGLGAESESTGDRTVALGHGTQASAQLATALGSEATASGARSTVVGEEASATATRAIAVGAKAKAAGRFAVAIGEEADGSGENGTAVGPEAKAQGKNSVAAGYQAKALSEGEIAIGTSAGNGDNRSNVNNAVSIGTSAHARETGGVALGNAALANLGKSVAIGDSAKASNADSIAIGSGATASGGAGSIAIGSHSSVGRASGAAGGPRWSTSNDIGGRWYTWTGAKNATQGTDGTWTTTIDPQSTVWQSNLGAVSIGTDGLSGTTYTRQLTGLAAGTQDTDAVNVAQWKNTMLATIGDAKEDSTNTRYGTDNVARNVTRLVNEYLTLTGAADNGKTLTKDQLTTDANIGTIVGDNKITFRLSKDLKGLDSVTTGNTKMESKGITITNPDDKTKNITLDGTTGRAAIGGVTVGHVNDGELRTSKSAIVPAGNYVYNLTNTNYDPTDYVSGRAATEDQLHQLGDQVTGDINNITQVLDDGTFGLSADDDASTKANLGSTIKVKGDSANITTKVDGTDLQIELNKDLNLGNNGSVTMGDTTINNSGITIKNSTDATKNVSLTDAGLNNGGNKITNVANGDVSANSTDAVNGSQLNEVKQNITNVDKHHTEVTVAGEAAPAAEGTYTEGNLQIAQKTGDDGQKIYDLKLNDNLNIGGAGKDGAPGQNGHMGINGADGKSGVGIDGKDGISITGKDGKDGVTIKGIDGKDGVDGAEGHIGLNGKDGITDIWTTAGTPGLNGKDGETMTRIVYKDPKGDTHEAATLDDGLKFGGDFGTTSAVKLNKQVNVKGNATTEADLTDGNIGVVSSQDSDNGQLLVKLNKDLNLGATGSVKMGNTTINNGGVTITNPNDNKRNVSLTDQGLNNGGNKITNVANGDVSANSTDAVNGSQLNEVKQNITNVDKHHTEVTVAGEAAPAAEGTYTEGNLQIAQKTGDDGQKIYDLKLNDNLNIGGAGKDGAPGQNGHMGINGADGKSGVGIDGKDGISITGKDGKDGVTIKGIDGKDGVDGAEGHIGLNGKDGITDIWTTAGTPGLNGKDGETMTRIVYKDPKGDTHEAATLDDGLKFGGDFGTTSAVKLNKQVNVKGNATTEADLTDGNIGVVSSQDSDNGQLLVKLNKDLNLGATGSVKMGNTTINNGGITIKNSTDATKNVSLTNAGLNNGGNKITNIAKGDVKKDSTDAVNGGQLYDVEQKIQDVEKTAGQHTTVEAGSANVSVKEGTNGAGGKAYTVDLATDVKFGSDANQIAINGTDGTVTVGTGDKQVKLDGTNGSVTAGGVTINKDGKGTIDGLTNTTWTEGAFTSGQAATEDQLHTVESNVNKKIDNINTAIENVDKHHTEVTVNGEAAPADGTYTEGNLQIAQTKGADGQKIYDLKLSDNLNIGGVGKDGKDGKDGHMGINGADGQSGVGIDGKDGISIKGKDGQNGITIKGVDGKDGTEGHIGLTGPKGADGQNATADIHVKNGQHGVDGTDGHGGKDGMDRVVYEDHNGTSHEVATMDDGMKYSGDSGNAAVKLNNNVQISGGATEYADGANIGVVASQDGDNAKLQVKLAKDLTGIHSIEATTINAKTVNSDTFQSGNTTINNSGVTIMNPADETKNVSLTDKGLNNGGNKITNIAAGDVSEKSTDAVNGSQLYQRDQVISKIGGEVNKLDRRVDRVGAGAAALAALHPQDFDPDDKWDFAAGYGNYRGANAAAVGAFYRPNEDTTFSIGGTVGGGENMINAGISIKFGQGNHVSNSRVAMAKELLALKDYIKAQDEKIEKLESLIGQSQGNTMKRRSILFPDVPENHWAYAYVKKLADRGLLEGYPDGEFKGDRTMTRYEFAAIFARALDNGLKMDADTEHMSEEFAPEIRELSLNRFRVDRIAGEDNDRHKIERVRVNNRDEIIQDKNGENTKRYRDVYGDVIEKTVDAASR